MPKPRIKAKVDTNQSSIVKELRKIPGVSVELDHDDILVGYRGRTYWFEIKNPDCVSRKTGKILESTKQPSQVKLEKEWRGHYRVVWNINQILLDMRIGAY